MQLSLLGKSRRRQKVRAKLEEVARVVSSPQICHDDGLALFSETDCAVITESGDVIVTKTGSSRKFEAVAPKIKTIRASVCALCKSLGQTEPDVVHVRGQTGMLHAYALGGHALVTLTEVSPGARNLDAVVARVDKYLGVGGEGRTLIEELAIMLKEL